MPEQDRRRELAVDLALAFFVGAHQPAFPASLPSYILVENVVTKGDGSPARQAHIMPDCACK